MSIIERILRLFRGDSHYEKLQNEIDRYRRIFSGVQNYGFMDWDLNKRKIEWHGTYWESLGYSQEDMTQISDPNHFPEFVHPDDREKLAVRVRSQIKGKVTFDGSIFRIKKKHGGHVWTDVRVEATRDSSGWAKYVSGVMFDVTRLKQTEYALLESEARYGRIIQAANDGIWEWSADDNQFNFSDRCWQQLGYSEEDIQANSEYIQLSGWRDRIHPGDIEKYDRVLNEHIVSQAPFDLEYRMRSKTDDWVWIRSRGHMVFKDDGSPHLMSGTNMDVTQLKIAERKVLESKEAAEVANQAKSEFLSAMSHELRTPLNAILGFAQLFDLDHNLTEDQRDNILEIKSAGRHLLKLVGDVLDLSKIEAGRTEFNCESIMPVRIIKSCLNLLKSEAEKRSINITFKEHVFGDYAISVDSICFKQIMINLISNAVKYNRVGGEVVISCERSADRLDISIRDTGMGIPLKFQSELFQPFNRLGAEKSNIEGSGVGLVITKKLTEHMNGTINFKTSQGEGTTFWVSFPLVMDDDAQPYDQSNVDNAVQALLFEDHKKILYVEDNASSQRLMSQLIMRYANLDLMEADQALQGLYLARTQSPDLIILDINLPGMNGFEMLEVLKQDPLTKNIPVIALSANAMAYDVKKGQNAGFDYYLTKPIDLAQFVSVCNSILVES